MHCKQEDSDGRFHLHPSHAPENGVSDFMTCSEDTDVSVMSIGYQDQIGFPLFVKCGIRNYVSKVANTASPGLCSAFTGCDNVSAFAGKGKTQALKLVMTDSESPDTCTKLGRLGSFSRVNEKLGSSDLLYLSSKNKYFINRGPKIPAVLHKEGRD